MTMEEDKHFPGEESVNVKKTLTQPDKGWAWVVMVASLGAHIITGGLMYGVGIIHSSFLERFQENITKTSWAGTVYLAATYCASPLAGTLMNRYSCRVSLIVGSLLSTVGFLATALVKSLDLVMLTFGVVAGVGIGITYATHVVVIGFNFKRHLNLATGLASGGIALGIFIFSPILQTIRDHYGNSNMFFIFAGISMHLCVFGAMFFPSQLEFDKRHRHFELQDLSVRETLWINIKHYFKIFLHKRLLCLALSLAFGNTAIALFYIHLPEYAIEHDASPIQAAFLLSAHGISNLFVRPLVGMAANADNIDETVLYSGGGAFLGISALLLPLYGKSYTGQLLFAVIFGYNGCFYVMLSSLCLKCVKHYDLATAYGIVFGLSGIGSIVGPPIAGFIVESGGTYEQSFIFAGSVFILSAVLGAMTVCFKGHDKEEDESHKPESLELIIDKPSS